MVDAAWDVPGEQLQSAFDSAGIRVVLARRFGREGRKRDDGIRVILARCGPGGWAATTTVDDGAGLLGIDWATLANGPNPTHGWSEAGQVWAICTHGTRDACCARLGRPLAAAFDAQDPHGTWEISHSGGHRFAGVAIAFPEGLVYGRVGPQDVEALRAARAAGAVVPALLRGAVHLSPPQQSAQAALREHLDETGIDALRALDDDTWRHEPPGGAATTWRVEMAQSMLAERPASCGKAPEPAVGWVATALTRVD